MAYTDGYTGNATSGIGQGLAFVLPESKAVSYAMQLSQQHAAELRAEQLRKQQLQQQQEQQYQQQLMQQKVPEYWSKVGQAINDNFNKWTQDAAAYHAKTGLSPFSNPEFIKRYNDQILLPARQSKEVENQYTGLLAKVAADTDNKYTEESKKAVADWVAAMDKNPTSVIGKPAPQLVGTPSGIQDFYKTIKPVFQKNNDGTWDTKTADVSAMMNQAYLQSNDPKWNSIKRDQYGIDPSLGDIGSVYNDKGKRVWYTNPTAVGHIADQILENPTEPHNVEILTKAGIDPTENYAKEKLQTIIAKQNAGYGKLITDAGKYGQSLVSPESERTFAADNNARGWASLALSKQRFAWEKEKKDGTDDGRDTFIDDLVNGKPQAQTQLINAAKAFGGHFSPSKDGFTITMPEKRREQIKNADGTPALDGNGNPIYKDVATTRSYTIPDDGSDASKTTASALLNHLDLFKKRAQYDNKHNIYGSGTPAPIKPQSQPKQPRMVTFSVNGQLGQIPTDQVKAFLKKYPNAVQQ